MRKKSMMALAALLLLWPMTGAAEGLPDFLDVVSEGVSEGLASGTQMAIASMDQELTLEMSAQTARIEEGKTITLTVTVGNPRPTQTPVTLELKLPARLVSAQDTTWEAVLEPAQLDAQTGELVPSVATFTRDITLTTGGESEQVTIEGEMSMGTRFYRAKTELELCVPDISASATAEGSENGRLRPGDAFTYQVEVVNAGMAPKDVPVLLVLPQGVELDGGLSAGFVYAAGRVSGVVRAEAAQIDDAGAAASRTVVSIPLRVADDALEGDEDAMRLLNGTLRVDGERIPLPRIQVCGSKVSAKLLPEADSLEAGEEMNMRVVVVNAGLADADVRVSCVLPEGITLVREEEEDEKEATPAQAIAKMDDGEIPETEAVAVADAETAVPAVQQENNTLIFNLHMDAASEEDGAVTASTRVLELRVKADVPQEKLKERLVGATLAWSVDDGQAQIGEAVAMRVYKPAFMGIAREEWNGIFWASVLLVVTVCLLYAAVRTDEKKDEYVYD